ncbi:predicted protein [Botrytis cinerea T4]|uniref:Uncharacterized protein n=1 Tax=Botryotinia fuckeliana (strain T4) TaxID=999810 RepID=G2Y498_BOTF4|nr:predicted protein [Botrytis cinerea T4]
MTGGLKNQNLIGSHVYHNRLKGPLVHWFIAYQGYTIAYEISDIAAANGEMLMDPRAYQPIS